MKRFVLLVLTAILLCSCTKTTTEINPTELFPKTESAPPETGESSFLAYTYTISCLNDTCPCTCQVTLSLPETWQPDEMGVFYDTQREKASCLRTIRFVPPTSISDATVRQYDYTEAGEQRITKNGYIYYADIEFWQSNEPWTGVTNHACMFPLDTDKNHLVTIFLTTYPAESDVPDPDEYYDTYILPILDNIQFEKVS